MSLKVTEILWKIASYCDVADIPSVSAVSKELAGICRDNLLWKRFCLRDIGSLPEGISDFRAFYRSHGQKIRILKARTPKVRQVAIKCTEVTVLTRTLVFHGVTGGVLEIHASWNGQIAAYDPANGVIKVRDEKSGKTIYQTSSFLESPRELILRTDRLLVLDQANNVYLFAFRGELPIAVYAKVYQMASSDPFGFAIWREEELTVHKFTTGERVQTLLSRKFDPIIEKGSHKLLFSDLYVVGRSYGDFGIDRRKLLISFVNEPQISSYIETKEPIHDFALFGNRLFLLYGHPRHLRLMIQDLSTMRVVADHWLPAEVAAFVGSDRNIVALAYPSKQMAFFNSITGEEIAKYPYAGVPVFRYGRVVDLTDKGIEEYDFTEVGSSANKVALFIETGLKEVQAWFHWLTAQATLKGSLKKGLVVHKEHFERIKK